MLRIAREFFELPEEERLKLYSDNLAKIIRLSTSFNLRNEKIASWRDFLGLPCYPLEDYIHEWPNTPASFRDIAGEYCKSARGLALELIEAISESLGLDKGYITSQLGKQGQHMAMSYYPSCPEPDLTYGLPPHTDHYAITVLLNDEVPGLQVFKDGQWVEVRPIPNTFIINIGDQIQVMSNGKYKSGTHRVVVNCDKDRISIPTFYSPSPDAVIGPAPQLITDDEPAVYRQYTWAEYDEKVWGNGLEKCLDMFLVENKSNHVDV
ncbi:hypothetical protein L1987_79689 [Smallanthus sonchifolius]|uniref:Uncharacterized protein n=1 Tax=Smallanthus sonchifolius TaxID=185202 RepID=A0ACB8YPS8_9ASTR|nr:hypothetical protein L1987_79689 [Smallanthus sonchifolius]